MNSVPQEIQKLSPAEKLNLVEALWDDIAQTRGQIPVSDEIKAEVLRRAAWRRANPGHGKPLEEIIHGLGIRL